MLPGQEDILGITPGDHVLGSFVIDLDAPIGSTGDTFAYYNEAVVRFQLVVDGVHFSAINDGTVFLSNDSLLPTSPVDAFEITGMQFLARDTWAALHLNIVDSTGSMFSDLALDNAADLHLDSFGRNFILSFPEAPAPVGYTQAIVVDWQSLRVVPEPSTVSLLALGMLALLGCKLRRRQ
jgi:hypothetical protein